MNNTEIELSKNETITGFKRVKDIIEKNICDMLILDEFIWVLNKGMISLQEAKELILSKSSGIELVLTGRDASHEIIKLADYVTEMKKIKHPYEKGIGARIGVEK